VVSVRCAQYKVQNMTNFKQRRQLGMTQKSVYLLVGFFSFINRTEMKSCQPCFKGIRSVTVKCSANL
jgi:hypothetical protein